MANIVAPATRPTNSMPSPPVGVTSAQELIAEIGVGITRFPTVAHLVSWAKFCPRCRHQPASPNQDLRAGNRWLAGALGDIAAGAARTDTFLGARYRRLTRRRGKQQAIVATGDTVLTIVYHLLADPDARFHDLGADHYDSRISTDPHSLPAVTAATCKPVDTDSVRHRRTSPGLTGAPYRSAAGPAGR